jgi:hypothetical protein
MTSTPRKKNSITSKSGFYKARHKPSMLIKENSDAQRILFMIL